MIRRATRLATVPFAAVLLLAHSSFQAPLAQAPAGDLVALTGARLIDGTGRAPIEQATVLVRNGRVEAAGAAAAVQVPAGAVRVNLSGKTLMPGIINAHGHVNPSNTSTLPVRDQLVNQLRLYADYGITTVYGLGTDGPENIALRREQEQGPLNRARVYAAGRVLTKTVDEVRRDVNSRADMGVDIIKIHINGNADDIPPDAYAAIIDQAHKRGLMVAAHLYYTNDAWGLLKAGVDVFAHSVRDKDIDASLIAEMKRRNVGYIATLTRDLSVFVYETTPPYFKDPFFLRHITEYRPQMTQVSEPAFQEKMRASKEAQVIKEAIKQATRNVKILVNAGVPVAMGTDTGAQIGRWQGYFEHVEMELMVKGGLTPMQVLVAATGDAARVMRLGKDFGTIQPGKWADFLVLNADPLADIRNTRQIDSVWIAGRRLTNSN
jgi:imidazolonepropionase-like amidohydrolase